MYVCIYIYIYIHTHDIYNPFSLSLSIYVYLSLSLSLSLCICIYIYICVYIYIYMYIIPQPFWLEPLAAGRRARWCRPSGAPYYSQTDTYLYISLSLYIYIYIYIYTHLKIRKLKLWKPTVRGDLSGGQRGREGETTDSPTLSFHNFKSRKFKLSVSNPTNKYVAHLSVLSRISNCQGLGRKNKFEILKTDRIYIYIYIHMCVYVFMIIVVHLCIYIYIYVSV